ncbi:glycoside hydrolase superfamily [Tribonema minus]|uniref:Glycoside hydrolase superfamily n=1 Tax=Tribonema minus TaxID=303371 RepID=A0A835Z3A8_9STRA|nr:glycoside hydrolase superfamily [Tribonema minus]
MAQAEVAAAALCTHSDGVSLSPAMTKKAARRWPAVLAAVVAGALMVLALTSNVRSSRSSLSRVDTVMDESRQLPSARSLAASRKAKPSKKIKPTIGVSMGSMAIDDREKQVGAHIPIAMTFQPCMNVLKTWDDEIVRRQKLGHEIVLVLEFNETSKKVKALDLVLSGFYDKKLRKIGRRFGRMKKHRVWVRILHEFNSDWYPWGTFKEGNSIPKFKQAYRYIVKRLRKHGAGDNIKFQLSYNARSSGGDKIDFSKWWPGDAYVDMIMITAYNRAGTLEGTEKPFQQFAEFFPESYKRVAALHPTKPIGISEAGSTDAKGAQAKADWYYNMFKTLKESHAFPRLAQVNFFLEDKIYDWRLDTREEQTRFGDGMRLLGYKAIKRDGES